VKRYRYDIGTEPAQVLTAAQLLSTEFALALLGFQIPSVKHDEYRPEYHKSQHNQSDINPSSPASLHHKTYKQQHQSEGHCRCGSEVHGVGPDVGSFASLITLAPWP
jgi:hypothetical protein